MSLILDDVSKFITSKVETSNIDETNYVSTENMLPNKGGVCLAASLPDTKSVRHYLPDDILINNIRPYFKKIWFANKEGGCSNDVFVLRANENYDSKFLYYVLSSDDFFSYVMANAKGTKMPRGDKKAIQNYIVPDFSIKDQITISHFLSNIDKKIEINKKINKNLYEIINEKFKFYVKDFSHLETVLLSDCCDKIIRGFNSKYVDKSNLINLNQKVNKGEFLEKEHFKYLDENLSIPVEKFAKKKDILLNSLGEGTLGRVHYFYEDGNNIVIDQHITIIRSNEEKLPSSYIYQYLKSSTGQYHLDSFISGSTGMLMLNISYIRNLEIPILPKEQLNEFDNFATNLFKKIALNTKEIEELVKLRDALLPKLMSGEIDVSQINCDLKIIITFFYKKDIEVIIMKTKLISKIQNQMEPYLSPEQYLKLTNSLLNTFKDIEITDKNNELSEIDNFKLLKLFLSAKQVEGCSNKTITYYKSTIEKMLGKIKKQVYNISTDDLRTYLFNHKAEKNSSKTTIDNIRRIFSSFFSWLEDEDYILKNPVRRIHRVKTGRVVKEVLSDENLEVLRDNCEEKRDLAIVELLTSTGIRVGELVRLNISDIDFYERECVVFGKGESERVVYFDARTKIHLIEYLQSRNDNNPALFVSLNKPHERLGISGIETRLRELGNKCNIKKVHPHKFRRTLATNAIDKGMPIEQLQKLLGHVQIDTTMQYAMVNQSNVKLAHRKFIG